MTGRSAARALIVAALLGVLIFQGLGAARSWAPTADEFSHQIASNTSSFLTRDFRMNPVQPPLPRHLMALPLVFLGAKLPLNDPSWSAVDVQAFARAFFYVANSGRMDELVFWARMPILALSVVFGLAVQGAASALFGPVAGLAALALYVSSPNIVAHSALATSDLAVALFFFLSLRSFEAYLRAGSRRHLVLSAAFTALTFLSKFSAVLLPPFLVAAAVLGGRRKRLTIRAAAAFAGITVLVIWAGYFFEVKPLLENVPDRGEKAEFIRRIAGDRGVAIAERAPVPLATFGSALVGIVRTRHLGTHSYLMGEWSDTGWPHYYFVTWMVKETLPFLALILLSLILLPRLPGDRLTKTFLTVPIAGFFLATLGDRAQVGIRYFLPVFPSLFILAGGVAAWLWGRGKAARAVLLGLLIWHATETLRVGPHYLAYFNQIAGGPSNGYKWLRDSNLDWGQDLKGLGEYLKTKGDPEVTLFLYSPAEPASYGIRGRRIETEELEAPRAAFYALGAHNIDAVQWAAGRRPDAEIGHTIFLYDLREEGR